MSRAENGATSGAASAAEGQPNEHPSEADRYQMIRTYFRMLIEEELPDAVGKMKQFASWFTHGVPGGAGLRKAIYESKSAVEILGRVEEFFDARLCGVAAPSTGAGRALAGVCVCPKSEIHERDDSRS